MPTIEETNNWVNEIKINYVNMLKSTIEHLNSNHITFTGKIKLTFNTPRTCYVKEVINSVEQDSFGIIEFDQDLKISQFKTI